MDKMQLFRLLPDLIRWNGHTARISLFPAGADCAWIDLIDFAGSSAVSYIQKDLQVARIITPVQKDKFGREMVSVKVVNLGKDSINGFNLAYDINDRGIPVSQTFDNVYPYSGIQLRYHSVARVESLKYGDYNIVAYAYDNNDDYLLNDTLRIYLENDQLTDSIQSISQSFH